MTSSPPTVEAPATSRVGRQLRAVSVLIGVGYVVLLVLWPDGPFAFTFDDAYYYFGIAEHVAAGDGSTFDGINATNGYHPLWLATSVPVFLIGLDGMAAVRVLLVAQVVAYAAALWVMAGYVQRAVARWPEPKPGRRPADRATVARCEWTVLAAWALFAANPFVVKVFVNGLESGISVLLYALLLLRVLAPNPVRLADTTARWRAVTGLLLLLVFLARTDAAILAACLCVWYLFEQRTLPWRTALSPVAELFAPVAIGGVAYLIFNQVVFGTAVQVSGLHKRAPLDGPRVLTFGVLAGLGVVLALRAWRTAHEPRGRRGPSRFPRLVEATSRTGWFAAFCFILLGYYNALQTQQWLWYYAPLAVYALLLLPLAVADFLESGLAEAPAERSSTRALAPIQAILLVPLVVALCLQVPAFADPEVRSIQVANRQTGEWISANLPDDAVLASWDAGVVGYFADRPVVNLDGVVNSLDYYQAARDGRVDEFLREAGVTHVVNHGHDVGGEDPDIRAYLASRFGDEVADGARVVHRRPFVFSGVTAGSGGVESADGRSMAVFVYEVDLDR